MALGDWMAVLGGSLGAFMAILDIQVTNASLREIQGALGLDMSESSWISTSYLIAEILVIPLTAKLSEVFGLRRYMIWNCVGFLVASLLCGLSWNLGSLIAFRALQGATGGTLIPMAFQLILQRMPENKKAIGLTLFGLTVTLAPTLGPSIGGWLTETQGWRSIFLINLFPGAFMILALRAGLPKSSMDRSKLRTLDVPSLAGLAVGLSSLTYVLEEGPRVGWFDDFTLRLCAFGMLIGLPFFVVRQFTLTEPLLNLRLFRNRNFALGTLITAISGCALFSGIYALSLYLGQVQDYSALQIGSVMMWVGLPQLLMMPFLPFLMKKVDLRLLATVGMLLFAYSNHMNSHLNLDFGGDEFRTSLLIRALGQPLFVIPLSMMAMGMVRVGDSGDASSIFNVMRNLGASLGIALTSTFLVGRQSYHLLRYSESVSAFDFNVNETLYSTEQKLRGLGFDATSARLQAVRGFIKHTVRDSVIQAFSDIFYILTCALVLTCILILCLKKTKVTLRAPGPGDAH